MFTIVDALARISAKMHSLSLIATLVALLFSYFLSPLSSYACFGTVGLFLFTSISIYKFLPGLFSTYIALAILFGVANLDISFLVDAPAWSVAIWLIFQVILGVYTSYGWHWLWAASAFLVTVNHGWAVLYWSVPLILVFYGIKSHPNSYLANIRLDLARFSRWFNAVSELGKKVMVVLRWILKKIPKKKAVQQTVHEPQEDIPDPDDSIPPTTSEPKFVDPSYADIPSFSTAHPYYSTYYPEDEYEEIDEHTYILPHPGYKPTYRDFMLWTDHPIRRRVPDELRGIRPSKPYRPSPYITPPVYSEPQFEAAIPSLYPPPVTVAPPVIAPSYQTTIAPPVVAPCFQTTVVPPVVQPSYQTTVVPPVVAPSYPMTVVPPVIEPSFPVAEVSEPHVIFIPREPEVKVASPFEYRHAEMIDAGDLPVPSSPLVDTCEDSLVELCEGVAQLSLKNNFDDDMEDAPEPVQSQALVDYRSDMSVSQWSVEDDEPEPQEPLDYPMDDMPAPEPVQPQALIDYRSDMSVSQWSVEEDEPEPQEPLDYPMDDMPAPKPAPKPETELKLHDVLANLKKIEESVKANQASAPVPDQSGNESDGSMRSLFGSPPPQELASQPASTSIVQATSESTSQTAPKSVSQTAAMSASQPASKPASLPALPANQPALQPANQPANQTATRPRAEGTQRRSAPRPTTSCLRPVQHDRPKVRSSGNTSVQTYSPSSAPAGPSSTSARASSSAASSAKQSTSTTPSAQAPTLAWSNGKPMALKIEYPAASTSKLPATPSVAPSTPTKKPSTQLTLPTTSTAPPAQAPTLAWSNGKPTALNIVYPQAAQAAQAASTSKTLPTTPSVAPPSTPVKKKPSKQQKTAAQQKTPTKQKPQTTSSAAMSSAPTQPAFSFTFVPQPIQAAATPLTPSLFGFQGRPTSAGPLAARSRRIQPRGNAQRRRAGPQAQAESSVSTPAAHEDDDSDALSDISEDSAFAELEREVIAIMEAGETDEEKARVKAEEKLQQ
ncbi:hypothetical protein F5Y04DRAFT_278200 [Hypomontagnella monticulosa]|nr:hypothetical protein F5Y04DRAFT_278200 [Hypomontagnella monticulosa]